MATIVCGALNDRNQDATVYIGGLDEKCSEAIVWELFVQAGPVVSVHMPKDRITGTHQGFGFVEFMSEEDSDYAIKVMNMIKLYGKPIRVNKASAHQKNVDIGANIFVGNLDPEVDEKLLYDTFSAFGVILQVPKIMRDADTGNPKGFAFVNYASFEASDASIDAMNGQYLCNRAITVSYAFKKDARGERHGTAAERMLANQNPLNVTDRPHQIFADAPHGMPGMPAMGVPGGMPGMPGMGMGGGPGGMPPMGGGMPMAPGMGPPMGMPPPPSMMPYHMAPPPPMWANTPRPPPPPPMSAPPPPPSTGTMWGQPGIGRAPPPPPPSSGGVWGGTPAPPPPPMGSMPPPPPPSSTPYPPPPPPPPSGSTPHPPPPPMAPPVAPPAPPQ